MERASQRWVRFFPTVGVGFDPGAGAHVNRYEVRKLVTVAGGPHLDLKPGSGYMRVESTTPWSQSATHAYHGVTEHVHYTTAAQARLLARDAVNELAPGRSTGARAADAVPSPPAGAVLSRSPRRRWTCHSSALL